MMRSDTVQSLMDNVNAADTSIGGTSVSRAEKAGHPADKIQSIENSIFHETEEEKRQFVSDSFKLDENEILNEDEKLKEAVIQLLINNFEV